MKKVKTLEDFAVLSIGTFVICLGLVLFVSIASVIVRTAEHLDTLLF